MNKILFQCYIGVLINYIFSKLGKGKKIMFQKIKDLLKNRLILMIAASVFGFFIITYIINFAFHESLSKSEVSKQVNYYYYTWADFNRVSGKDLHDLWNKKYHDAIYEWNGNAKYNTYDCTSSIYSVLRDLKSNFQLMSVDDLYNRLMQVSSKRTSYSDVKTRDLIIIYIKERWHVGIVEGKSANGMINYMDMNIASSGAGYKQVAFGSGVIKGIFPITFELWLGDLLKNVKDLNVSK